VGAFQAGDRWRWRGCRPGRGRCHARDGRRDPARWRERFGSMEPVEERVPSQAGVTRPAFGIEDLDAGPATGRAVAVPGDGHLAPPADDVPAEPDPALGSELQPEAARLLDGGGKRPRQGDRLEHDEQRARPPGERREPAQPISDPRPCDRGVPPVGQVDDEQVDGPGGEERAGHRERLLEVHGHQHDEPLGPNPATHRLDGVERLGEVEPCDDRARCLGLRGNPKRKRRPARARLPPQRDRRGARQAARPEDGVERGEPGRDDPSVRVLGGTARARRSRGEDRRPGHDNRPGERSIVGVAVGERQRQRLERRLDGPREGAVRLVADRASSRSCAAPSCLERRERLGNVDSAAHRTSNNRTDVLVGQGPVGWVAWAGARGTRGGPGRPTRRSYVTERRRAAGAPKRSITSHAREAQGRSGSCCVLHSPAGRPEPGGCGCRGDVAQLGEHRVRIAGVRGSSPLISTTSVGRLGRW
jgi:hypothetical protein